MEPEETSDVILPEGTSLYCHQVAGHEYDGNTKLGVLKHKSGAIIKPVKEKNHHSARELLFYEKVFSSKNLEPIISELTNYLPKFLGTCETRIKDKEVKFLCLEDICDGFLKPSILDIKIGKVTYDPEATEAKIEYEKIKYLYSEVLGFRILGMKIYNDEKKAYTNKDKKFGKQVTPENMKNALELILTRDVYINYCILCGFLHKLCKLENWFKRQRKFAFYSSSLLFVYEGMLDSWYEWIENNLHNHSNIVCYPNTCDKNSVECIRNIFLNNSNKDLNCDTCSLPKNVCHEISNMCHLLHVAIIDCAHVFPSSTEDYNYIFGLEKLKEYIQILLNDQIKLLHQT